MQKVSMLLLMLFQDLQKNVVFIGDEKLCVRLLSAEMMGKVPQ
jgi:hypothetical protein